MTKRLQTLRSAKWAPIQDHEILFLEQLGAEVRRLRKDQDLTIRLLAKWIGFSHETIRQIEEGGRRTRRSTLARIAHVLGADVEELVRLAGPALAPESMSSRKRALRPLPPEPPAPEPKPPKPEPPRPDGCWWPTGDDDSDPFDPPGSFVP